MYIITFVSVIVAIISILILFLYRRQVKELSAQVSRIVDNSDSNIILTREISLDEVNELAEKINELREVTRRVEIECERKDDELKKVITNISHDIRTPLTSLSGYFELMCEALGNLEEQERYRKIIVERINCLKDMLDELFTYAKIQNNEYEIELEKVDVREVLCDTLLSFYNQINDNGMEAEVNIPEESAIILSNSYSLKRIFQNIIKNALEHGNDVIRVTFDKKDKVNIVIANRMPEEPNVDAAKVFDRFYKCDSARSNIATGLGLSIAKGLTEKLGGTISATVSGCEFIIRIEL